jgi:hypothetical protein
MLFYCLLFAIALVNHLEKFQAPLPTKTCAQAYLCGPLPKAGHHSFFYLWGRPELTECSTTVAHAGAWDARLDQESQTLFGEFNYAMAA